MLKVHSAEWNEFIHKLEVIKTKSNREVLCIQCWQMLNCKQKIKHLKKNPDHEKFLLTSTKYASEKQMLSLAKTQNKLVIQGNESFVITPYGPFNRQYRDQAFCLSFPNEFKMDNQLQSPLLVGNPSNGFGQINASRPHTFQQFPSFDLAKEGFAGSDRFFAMNQKIDQMSSVLQVLVQQNHLVNQALQTLNQSIISIIPQSAAPTTRSSSMQLSKVDQEVLHRGSSCLVPSQPDKLALPKEPKTLAHQWNQNTSQPLLLSQNTPPQRFQNPLLDFSGQQMPIYQFAFPQNLHMGPIKQNSFHPLDTTQRFQGNGFINQSMKPDEGNFMVKLSLPNQNNFTGSGSSNLNQV